MKKASNLLNFYLFCIIIIYYIIALREKILIFQKINRFFVYNKKKRPKTTAFLSILKITFFSDYLVISLPITSLWISEVPSPMVQSFESL